MKKIGKKILSISKNVIKNTVEDVKTIKNIHKIKKEIFFKDFKSLEFIKRVINEASEVLNGKVLAISDSKISDILKITLSAIPGAAISYGALYGLGLTGVSAAGLSSGLATAGSLIGGGMAAGVFVLAAPIAITKSYGYGKILIKNDEKLHHEKEKLYKLIIEKQDDLNSLLKSDLQANKEQIEHLTSLNFLMKKIIKDLQHDLDVLSTH